MQVDEIESDNEFNSSETTQTPVFRSSYSTPPIHRHSRDWSPISLHNVDTRSSRSSVQDFSLFNKIRTSIYGNHLFRQLSIRSSADNVNHEVHRKTIFLQN
jgi:hypothetical protein